MTAYILCNIFMFDLHQRIIFVDEKGNMREIGVANLDNLSEMIADLCAKYTVNKVHLIGNKEYANVAANEICWHGATKYGNNYIEVEVN